jgi:hypothetical protein
VTTPPAPGTGYFPRPSVFPGCVHLERTNFDSTPLVPHAMPLQVTVQRPAAAGSAAAGLSEAPPDAGKHRKTIATASVPRALAARPPLTAGNT